MQRVKTNGTFKEAYHQESTVRSGQFLIIYTALTNVLICVQIYVRVYVPIEVVYTLNRKFNDSQGGTKVAQSVRTDSPRGQASLDVQGLLCACVRVD